MVECGCSCAWISGSLARPRSAVHDGIGKAEWLAATDLPSELEAIRQATARDLPLGTEEFVGWLEARLNRVCVRKKLGRKPTTQEGMDHQENMPFVD